MKKELRKQIYNKYNGHCAYCGKVISYDEMQVDHLIPRRLKEKYGEDKIECFENYMPACRRCNHYKRGNSIEAFRSAIEQIPNKLYRDNYIYKVAEDFGIVKSNYNSEVKFWFENFDKFSGIEMIKDKKPSYEQLEIFYNNSKLCEKLLRERLFVIGGCYDFGGEDPMVGSCIDCYYNEPDLFEKCRAFQDKVCKHRFNKR